MTDPWTPAVLREDRRHLCLKCYSCGTPIIATLELQGRFRLRCGACGVTHRETTCFYWYEVEVKAWLMITASSPDEAMDKAAEMAALGVPPGQEGENQRVWVARIKRHP
jgi:hypothetical protein